MFLSFYPNVFICDMQVESARDEEGSEEGENQEERRAVIRKLDLEVDPQCLGEMVTFLSQAKRRCDLQPFLRGYANYARWFQHRSRTFTHFKVFKDVRVAFSLKNPCLYTSTQYTLQRVNSIGSPLRIHESYE